MMTEKDFAVRMFSELARGTSLRQILDIARTEVFDNPIMVTNESFRILALSSDRDLKDDRVWREAEELGGFSEETIEIFRKDRESIKLFEERRAFLYATGLAEKLPRILMPVDMGRLTLGYLIIFGLKHEITDRDFLYAGVLEQTLNIILYQQPSSGETRLDLLDYTLKQLLDGNREMIANMPVFQMKQNFQAVSVTLPKDAKKKQYIPYLQESLTRCSRFNQCFVHGNSLFLLLNYDKEEECSYTEKVLSDLLERFDLVAGYSYPFRDLRQLRLYYQQALDTRRYGSKYVPGSHIYRYQDIQVDILVGQLPEEILGTLLSPDYKLLTEYDTEHGLALVETAAGWYRNMLNISATAAALHIHRNTVTYRLDLIRDKLGIAIDDMKVLQSIALSARVAARIHHS